MLHAMLQACSTHAASNAPSMPTAMHVRTYETHALVTTQEHVLFQNAQGRREKAVLDPRSVVYYIAAGQAIKIGTSIDVVRRLTELQRERPSVPLRLIVTETGGRPLEARRHLEFRESRLSGEWFALSFALAYHLAELLDPDMPSWSRFMGYAMTPTHWAAVNRLPQTLHAVGLDATQAM